MCSIRFALLATIIATLAACAAPRYQTVYRYEPPPDAAGRSCLVRCEQGLKACQDDCANNYSVCVQSLEPEAQARYADALKRFEGELDQYSRDLNRYHLSFSLGWGHHPGWYGAGWYDPYWSHGWPYGWYGPDYYPPVPPRAPSYAEELGRLRAERCNRDCGCQPGYDACFLSCGGIRTPEQRCIANCPSSP
mgnify:CR=1 FL=1